MGDLVLQSNSTENKIHENSENKMMAEAGTSVKAKW